MSQQPADAALHASFPGEAAVRAWVPAAASRVAVLAHALPRRPFAPGRWTEVVQSRVSGDAHGPGLAGPPFDAVISYLSPADPRAFVRTAVAIARPGATIIFVEASAEISGAVRATIQRLRWRRELRRTLKQGGLSVRRVVLVPSLERPFLWFDDQAPPRVIRHALAHFGFVRSRRLLQALSVFARDPFVAWWAPSLLHIVIAPRPIS